MLSSSCLTASVASEPSTSPATGMRTKRASSAWLACTSMEGYEGVVRLYCFYQSGNGGLNILGRNIGSVDDYQNGLSQPSGVKFSSRS